MGKVQEESIDLKVSYSNVNTITNLLFSNIPKATGEPAVCVSYSVVTALRQAIKSARNDAGIQGWFEMGIK